MLDPDRSRQSQSNIAPGVRGSDYIANHLLTAEQEGNGAFTTFVEKRLQTSDVDMFTPLSEAKLQM